MQNLLQPSACSISWFELMRTVRSHEEAHLSDEIPDQPTGVRPKMRMPTTPPVRDAEADKYYVSESPFGFWKCTKTPRKPRQRLGGSPLSLAICKSRTPGSTSSCEDYDVVETGLLNTMARSSGYGGLQIPCVGPAAWVFGICCVRVPKITSTHLEKTSCSCLSGAVEHWVRELPRTKARCSLLTAL